jgi:dipeptidyl aminopeptidase/acylaminoacyl peptidase
MQIALSIGTLARVPLEGGVPRQILSNIENADWSGEGSTLLITRQDGGNDRLESPPGKLIYQNGGFIGHPRFSPRGDRIAFFDQTGPLTDSGSVAVVDLEGRKTVLSTGWVDLTGLAWSRDGGEVWFTGNRDGGSSALFAVTLKGSEREVWRNAGDLVLFDSARDGRVLLGREDWTSGIYGLAPGETHERDLSWFDYSVASDLSSDGKNLLFAENGESSAPQTASYLRGMDGSPALRLGTATCWALNHSGEKVICSNSDNQLIEVPTKTGEVKTLTNDNLFHGMASWLPDQKYILFQGREPGYGFRLYIEATSGGKPQPVTPEGASTYFRVSPDGKEVAVAMGTQYQTQLYPLDGGDPRSIPSLEPGEVPIVWSADGASLYCQKLGELPINIFRVDLHKGTRVPWKQTSPPDPVGITLAGQVYMSADLKSYVYTIDRRRDVLYLVNGLR